MPNNSQGWFDPSLTARYGKRSWGAAFCFGDPRSLSAVAEEWGSLNVPDPLPVLDGLLAATSRVHGLALETRILKHVASSRAEVVNSFQP
jgi:hypothetical protein